MMWYDLKLNSTDAVQSGCAAKRVCEDLTSFKECGGLLHWLGIRLYGTSTLTDDWTCGWRAFGQFCFANDVREAGIVQAI